MNRSETRMTAIGVLCTAVPHCTLFLQRRSFSEPSSANRCSTLDTKGETLWILPRRNARCSRDSHPPPWRAMRDTHLRRIRTQGRYEWRKSSGCTRQSVAEECGLTVQGDTRGKPLGPHGQEPKSRSRDQVRCAEPDGRASNATIGARVLRRMSFSARFAASANYATTPWETTRSYSTP